MKINIICKGCGRNFDIWPSRSQYQKYCNKECRNANRAKIIQCLNCKKLFKRESWQFLRNRNNFCSIHCKANWQSIHLLGKNHPNWKGGIQINHNRVYIYSPNHPFCNKRKMVARYRLIVEKKIRRLLQPNEVVHHINGIENDDRFENLQLLDSNSKHFKLHRKRGEI